MKRGPRPILWPRSKAVFHRVVPAMADMRGEIRIVTDVMFPVATLPDATLRPCAVTGPHRSCRQLLGKARLDQSPTHRIVPVPRRQGPDAMHVVGHDHPCVDAEGSLGQRLCHRPSEAGEVPGTAGQPHAVTGATVKNTVAPVTAGRLPFGIPQGLHDKVDDWFRVGCVLARTNPPPDANGASQHELPPLRPARLTPAIPVARSYDLCMPCACDAHAPNNRIPPD